jgi:hypothetical protein
MKLFFLNRAGGAAIHTGAAFHAIFGDRIDIAFLNSATGAFGQAGAASQTLLGNHKSHAHTSLIIIKANNNLLTHLIVNALVEKINKNI